MRLREAIERARGNAKGARGRKTAAAAAAACALYAWVALPALSYVCSLAGAVAQGAPIAAAVAAAGQYFPAHLLRGIAEPQLWLGPQMTLPLALLAALAAAMLAPLAAEPRFPNRVLDAQPPSAGSNEHGSSRILRTPRELEEVGKLKSWPADRPEESRGAVYVGAWEDRAYGYNTDEHTLVLAPTRCGKTARLLVQQIACLGASGECIFCFDPKGELFGKTSEYLRDLGYKVNRLDFRYPDRGSRWNPLDRVNAAYQRIIDGDLFKAHAEAEERWAACGDPAEAAALKAEMQAAAVELDRWVALAEKEVDILVNTIFPREKGEQSGNKFYNDNGEQVLKIAIHLVASSRACPPGAKSILTVLRTMETYGNAEPLNPWNKADDSIVVPMYEEVEKIPYESHPAKKLLKSLDRSRTEYTKSFIGTAKTQLREFASVSKEKMMSGVSDFSMEDLVRDKTITYAIIPVNASNADKKFCIMYVDQMYNALVDYAAECGGRLPKRMNMIGEEMGQLPPITDLDGRLAIAASSGFRFILILQNYSKLESVYGIAAKKSIISNVNYKILLMSDDPETSREWSQVCGTYTQARKSTSSKAALIGPGTTEGVSESLDRRDRLSVAEISVWDCADCGVLVRHPGKPIMNVPAPAFYESGVGKLLGLGDEAQCLEKAERLSAESVHTGTEPAPTWELCLTNKSQVESCQTSAELAKRRRDHVKGLVEHARRHIGEGANKPAKGSGEPKRGLVSREKGAGGK